MIEGMRNVTREEFEALNADFYSGADSEELRRESIGEEVEYLIDNILSLDCDVEAEIRKYFADGITMVAYRRKIVDGSWIDSTAEALLDDLITQWTEEDGYGNPEEDINLNYAAREAMKFAIVAFVRGQEVWACEQCGEYTYSADELIEMMKQENPHWFDQLSGLTGSDG